MRSGGGAVKRQILARPARRMCSAAMEGAAAHTRRVGGHASASCTVSVFSSGDAARGVTLRGLLYEITDAELRCAMPLGVSNSFTGAAATVQTVAELSERLLHWNEA